ncbi:hypothetical protein RBI13_24030, partial [Alcaligenaceae bacterium A4P071]|nr:hypothetical protein [Alcaligenaceae bacterium A4P071]
SISLPTRRSAKPSTLAHFAEFCNRLSAQLAFEHRAENDLSADRSACLTPLENRSHLQLALPGEAHLSTVPHLP